MNASATASAYTNPEHPCWRFRTGVDVRPNFSEMTAPVCGYAYSGIVVVTMMKSMSSICRPAFLTAISAASRPSVAGVTSASIFPSTPRS